MSPSPKERIARSFWGPPDLDDPMLRSSRLGDDETDDADADEDEGIDGRTSDTLELRGARRINIFYTCETSLCSFQQIVTWSQIRALEQNS